MRAWRVTGALHAHRRFVNKERAGLDIQLVMSWAEYRKLAFEKLAAVRRTTRSPLLFGFLLG
jgi:hypothetical protein